MRAELAILEDPAAMAADRLAAVVRSGGHIALAGGSTPRSAYKRLTDLELDWSRSVLWFGDERCVPPDDPRSNYGMVAEAMLSPLGDAAPEVRRIRGELGPHDAAHAYEVELAGALSGDPPAFDLALMGLGTDGHTASLFPGQPALAEDKRIAVGVEHPGLDPYVPRVTLTLRVFNAAREVLFLVTGADKAPSLARAFDQPPQPQTPASLVSPDHGILRVFCDPAAAIDLTTTL